MKENLRRLRWQQERLGDGHSSVHVRKRSFVGEVATNVCKFVCGESVRGCSSGVSDHEGTAQISNTDPKEMAIALEHQQSRAEVHLLDIKDTHCSYCFRMCPLNMKKQFRNNYIVFVIC